MNTLPTRKNNFQSINGFRASLTNSLLIHRCRLNFACVLICVVIAFYFVVDILLYLLYCHTTYCLHNIVSGHPVLLLLKIDDDDGSIATMGLSRTVFEINGDFSRKSQSYLSTMPSRTSKQKYLHALTDAPKNKTTATITTTTTKKELQLCQCCAPNSYTAGKSRHCKLRLNTTAKQE